MRFVVLTLMILIALGIVFYGVDRIPERSLTAATMTVMKRRILRHANERGELPSSLDMTPVLEGFTERTADGWGRPIQIVMGPDRVVLQSLGADGRVGGEGEDADLMGVFEVRDEVGAFHHESVDWIRDPLECLRVPRSLEGDQEDR